MAKKEYEQLPRLDRIITAPILAPDGSLVIDPGYDPATRTYLKPADGLQNLKVPEVITKAKRKKALRFILEEFLVDFPFASEADRANAVSLFLLPFVRELIPGLVPAYLFDASKQGSGKGLLAKTLLYPGIGKVALTAEKGSAEEYRKHITSHLISSPTVIGYDNLTGDFGNGALAGALTMDVWEDRILGISRNMKATVRNLWVLTGNNLRLTGDMPRRIVLVRLVPKEERPDERPLTEFHQEDLPDWVHRNRHKLVLAALYLCEAWVQEGMPRVSEPIMGSYPEFSSIMGGILQVCELDGFLLNRAELRAAATPEENETAEFLRAWYEIWGATPVLARDVATELEGLGLAATIPTALTPYVYTGRLTKQLSYFLRAKRDGVFGGYQLHAHVPSGHSRKWWVEKVDEEEA